MTQNILIKEPQTREEFEAYYLLRYNVLRKPWNQPPGSEKDEQEDSSIHAMAVGNNSEVLGVVRLQMNSATEAQLRFMGVDPKAQGLGIGKKLVHHMEEIARNKGASSMILQARENAVKFYESCGYRIVEKTFLMWGEIQHYLMSRPL